MSTSGAVRSPPAFPPHPALGAWIERVWLSDSPAGPAPEEAVLPTGGVHLVFRLAGPPIGLLGRPGAAPSRVGHAIIGGPRSSAYLRDVSAPARSLGIQLRPGAAALLGLPGQALFGQHVSLADVWGAEAERLHARLLESADPRAQLALVESHLLARLAGTKAPHPVVRHALARFARPDVTVADVVRESGYSHRRFGALFHEAVGLSPKVYARVQRLRRALPLLASDTPLALVALEAGYADQAHLSRDFREIAGLTPRAYRLARPIASHHVPLSRPHP